MPVYSVKDVVQYSYKLVLCLPLERDEEGWYYMKSRNKIRNLAKPLYEIDQPQTALERFREYSGESLTHPENATQIFENFRTTINDPGIRGGINQTLTTTLSSYTPEVKRKKIQEIINYTNLGAESICNIFSASPNEDEKVRKRLAFMIDAEFAVLGENGESDYKTKLVDGLMNLKKNADAEFNRRRQNHV